MKELDKVPVYRSDEGTNVLINALLDIVHKTRETPNLLSLQTEAMNELALLAEEARVRLAEYTKLVAERDLEIARLEKEEAKKRAEAQPAMQDRRPYSGEPAGDAEARRRAEGYRHEDRYPNPQPTRQPLRDPNAP